MEMEMSPQNQELKQKQEIKKNKKNSNVGPKTKS
jgi:hypothetical protein